ncbi:MAG: peptidoglycan editing factor PgeF [Syntrophales bacterium]|nr:peptidoglycan editing factor PgeF [Syntrophales bacterium]
MTTVYTPRRKGAITCIQAPSLERFDFLTHAFCTRLGGVSTGPFAELNISPVEGDAPENIRENRRILSNSLEIGNGRLFLLSQVHGADVLIMDHSYGDYKTPPAYDAVITDQSDVALSIRTADCVPIFLLEPERRIIANIHAGWKGTARNIAGKVIAAMVEHFGVAASGIIAVIGPAIGPCCYEVDGPVMEALGPWQEEAGVCRPAAKEGRFLLDLPAVNRSQMIRAGIPAENISLTNLCTSCRGDLFFSHRRDRGKTGRQINVIMLKSPQVK